MSSLPEFFLPPGTFYEAFLVGACNAVNARRERDRWPGFLDTMAKYPNAASRDACEGFDKAEALIARYGRRIAKRWIVRLARLTRVRSLRWQRDCLPRRRRP